MELTFSYRDIPITDRSGHSISLQRKSTNLAGDIRKREHSLLCILRCRYMGSTCEDRQQSGDNITYFEFYIKFNLRSGYRGSWQVWQIFCPCLSKYHAIIYQAHQKKCYLWMLL